MAKQTMVLPHIAAVYVSGSIAINDEYSEYRWVLLAELEAFEPKVETIVPMSQWAARKLAQPDETLVEI